LTITKVSLTYASRPIEEHRHARRPTHPVRTRERRHRPSCLHARAANEALAERFEVSPRTIDNWIATIPEFNDALRKGRQVADESVVSALFARVAGMERKMTGAFCHNGQPVTASYTVQLPPDVRACIFWLRNRRPQQWREDRPLVDEADEAEPYRRVGMPGSGEETDAPAAGNRVWPFIPS
jgi:hypothetical protein